MTRQLYSYFRSSCSYRVRIALQLKELDYEVVPINLTLDGGQQHQSAYTRLNGQALVPTLIDEGLVLTQSLAILEYLEERYPEPALLPGPAPERARVRALCQLVACDIQPLNNLRVLNYLTQPLGHDSAARDSWYRHWIARGFAALEQMLASSPLTGAFCHGDTPTVADACLIPQVYNARRFQTDLALFPTICRIESACLGLEAFRRAAPEAQPDAPQSG